MIFTFQDLYTLAREKSPFYRKLYASLGPNASIEELPVVDQNEFWRANRLESNQLLTGPIRDGHVFKSGGTTGAPKFSIYTREEWNTFTTLFGAKIQVNSGDRVANLFYVGELYASFIFIMKSLEASSAPNVHFPMGGKESFENVLKTIQEFGINVLAGVPTSILGLTEYYSAHRNQFPKLKIEKILFGGESFYPDQREQLKKVFPGVEILSIGYASVDAGLLGYADSTCAIDEHRTFSQGTVLEIIDEETGAVIREAHRPGRALITNLTRSLMPVIRYPVGDRALWTEPEGQDRKFQILGRSEEAARIGPVSLYYEDVRSIVSQAASIDGLQLEINHLDLRDSLTLRIALAQNQPASETLRLKITELFSRERAMFATAVAEKVIHPLQIEWVTVSKLECNPRTGKLRRIIDRRK